MLSFIAVADLGIRPATVDSLMVSNVGAGGEGWWRFPWQRRWLLQQLQELWGVTIEPRTVEPTYRASQDGERNPRIFWQVQGQHGLLEAGGVPIGAPLKGAGADAGWPADFNGVPIPAHGASVGPFQ